MQDERKYLTCPTCRSCCLLIGPAARAIAADPPACPGCGSTMAVLGGPLPVTLRQAC